MNRVMSIKNDPYRRGAIAVFVAITLVTHFACASLAVDMGYSCALIPEAQSAGASGALGCTNLLADKLSDAPSGRLDRLSSMIQGAHRFHSRQGQMTDVGTWDSANGFFPEFRGTESEAYAKAAGREEIVVEGWPCGAAWGPERVWVAGNLATESDLAWVGALSLLGRSSLMQAFLVKWGPVMLG